MSKKKILIANIFVAMCVVPLIGGIIISSTETEEKVYESNIERKAEIESMVRSEVEAQKKRVEGVKNGAKKTNKQKSLSSKNKSFEKKSFKVDKAPKEGIDDTYPIIYVDDDNTGGPWDGTFEYPYQFIQDGVDAAYNGQTVYVFGGIYEENVLIKDKGINLLGEDYDSTMIKGDGGAIAVSVKSVFGDVFYGMIKGFEVRNSNGGGIEVIGGTHNSPNLEWEIRNNVIVNNATYGIYTEGAVSVNVENNLFYMNNQGIFERDSVQVSIINNTFSDNFVSALTLENFNSSITSTLNVRNNIMTGAQYGILLWDVGVPEFLAIEYNDVWGNDYNYDDLIYPGDLNISRDPLFVNPQERDFHLNVDSPCIDAGDPDQIYNDPDGSRNNMGMYGGPGATYPVGDVSDLGVWYFVDEYDPIYPDGYLAYTIKVSTIGLDDADNVEAVFTAPANEEITFVHHNTGECEIVEHSKAICTRDSLSVGTDWTIQYVLLREEGIHIPGTVKADVEVSSSTFDPLLTNNRAMGETIIEPFETLYVNKRYGDDENGHGTQDSPYKSINKGILEAGEGYMVKVAEGDYYENVEIDKKIALVGGFDADNWARDYSGRYKSEIHGAGKDFMPRKIEHPKPVVTIKSDYVRLEGFFIDNVDGSNQEGTINGGVSVVGQENVIIEGNVINQIGSIDGITSGSGIWMIRGKNIDVVGNTIADNDATGIYMNNSYNISVGDNAVVRNGGWGVYNARNGDARLDYSDLWNNDAGNVKNIVGERGMISVDPKFMNTAGYQYLPSYDSPLTGNVGRWKFYIGALKPMIILPLNKGDEGYNEKSDDKNVLDIAKKKIEVEKRKVYELRKKSEKVDIGVN